MWTRKHKNENKNKKITSPTKIRIVNKRINDEIYFKIFFFLLVAVHSLE